MNLFLRKNGFVFTLKRICIYVKTDFFLVKTDFFLENTKIQNP